MKQETVSGSGINWAICKSAPRSRQITTPAPHHWSFYRPGAIPAAEPTESKHWRQYYSQITATKFATLFQQNCHLSKPSSKDHTISARVHSYVNNSDMSDLFDVETVSQCLSQMKKGKAPGADGIEAEHLVYCSPTVNCTALCFAQRHVAIWYRARYLLWMDYYPNIER